MPFVVGLQLCSACASQFHRCWRRDRLFGTCVRRRRSRSRRGRTNCSCVLERCRILRRDLGHTHPVAWRWNAASLEQHSHQQHNKCLRHCFLFFFFFCFFLGEESPIRGEIFNDGYFHNLQPHFYKITLAVVTNGQVQKPSQHDKL